VEPEKGKKINRKIKKIFLILITPKIIYTRIKFKIWSSKKKLHWKIISRK